MIAYKLVQRTGLVLHSWNSNLKDKECVIYQQDIVSTPSFGKLFVFATLNDLYAFKESVHHSEEVWECEVEGAEPLNIICTVPLASHIIPFWKSVEKEALFPWTTSPPAGTLGVDSVKLLKRIA